MKVRTWLPILWKGNAPLGDETTNEALACAEAVSGLVDDEKSVLAGERVTGMSQIPDYVPDRREHPGRSRSGTSRITSWIVTTARDPAAASAFHQRNHILPRRSLTSRQLGFRQAHLLPRSRACAGPERDPGCPGCTGGPPCCG